MRYFEVTGPDVLIGRHGQSRIARTILVRKGKLATVTDDDPRVVDLVHSPYLREVDADGEPVTYDLGNANTLTKPLSPQHEEGSAAESSGGDESASTADAAPAGTSGTDSGPTRRRRTPTAESDGV